MTYHALAANFSSFFQRLNPSPAFQERAASEHGTITGLIEDRTGLARSLSPICFLQGSYKQDTAIYTINDVDIVALCQLWQPGGAGLGVVSWSRDQIFATVAAPLLRDWRYASKVHYGPTSMCIKVDLGIKIEILPVVYASGNNDYQVEPFRLYRPETGQWEDGYARYHQGWLTWKNRSEKTGGNFIPCIKACKHLRSLYAVDAVSFHIECLLFSVPDVLFLGSPADYIPAVLGYIAASAANDWYGMVVRTPCGDRDIFTSSEWSLQSWNRFHAAVSIWSRAAELARDSSDRSFAIAAWKRLLGENCFPAQVST
jgi:hypothetical protein